MVTFAEAALEEKVIPWTSNPVERTMGEVSKRCKNQWMSWKPPGLEAMLTLRLIRCLNPEAYESFVEKHLQREIKSAMSCDLSVTATRGRL